MKGIGYSHPEWGHGMWKDEVAVGSEQWNLADVDDTAFENQHVQHLMQLMATKVSEFLNRTFSAHTHHMD